MREKLKEFIHSRVFIVILMLVLVCTTLLVGTYAWFTWSSADNAKLVMSIGRMSDVVFINGNDITGGLTPVYNYTDGLSTTFSINNRNTDGDIVSYSINLNIFTIDNELISDQVKWAVVKEDILVAEGDLSNAGNGTSINLYNSTTPFGTTNYTFYIYIDANEENDLNMINKTITGSITLKTEAMPTLLNQITDLYVENYDSSKNIAFADGTGMNYYAPNARLMNDGLDSTGAIVNEESAINGTAGNIRYYGADDENLKNYIYFNCSDYSNQSSETCETWRIIGIVDGKVKIIRNESIGEYAYDRREAYCDTSETNCYDATTDEYIGTIYSVVYDDSEKTYYYGINDWSDASLMKMLNDGGTYYNTLNNKNSKTIDLISSSTWYINGLPNNEEVNLNYYDYYKIERTGESKWEGNIALPYPSDFAYARDLNVTGDSELIISSNWLATNSEIVDWNEQMEEIYEYWFISPYESYSDSVYINDYGDIYWYSEVFSLSDVRPTLYLEPDIVVNKGDGSSSNPYQIYTKPKTLIEYITDLYTSGNPELITHSKDDGTSDTYYYSYQDDTNTWGLMNDGLKVSSVYGAGATTITDTTALTTGTEGNIRYFGPDPDNYVYFNCKIYPDTNCELWRIIGIVDGKVKLIRSESIGDYSWDNKNTLTGAETEYGSNDWSNARIMRLLNPGYEDFVDKDNSGNNLIANNSLYWNSESGKCYAGQNNATKLCDFTSTGLKNDITRNIISESTWYLGGRNSSTIEYPNDMYNYERTNIVGTTIYGDNPYTITAKIGLMYPSDYGYGTNLTKCSKSLTMYDSSTNSYACRENNWLYLGNVQWLITPRASHSYFAWYIANNGLANDYYYFYNAHRVLPVLYLTAGINIVSGNGTSSNPYRLQLP